MPDKIVVCLPTYNESENLEGMVASLHHYLPTAQIIIIDDNSPDGTGKIADRLARDNGKIMALHRKEKKGLGPAYFHGFQCAIEKFHPDLIVQIDADFSHPVSVLSEMIRESANHDLVIGSRYVAGGGIQNWNWFRRLVSRFGSFYARFWLNLPIHDLTSGMKVWHADLLRHAISKPLAAGGYVFQVEMTYRAIMHGGRTKEIPIVFSERSSGKSKMSVKIAFEAFWRVPVLRLNHFWGKVVI